MIIIQKSPPVLNVAQQGIGFILGHDPHFSDTGIKAVGQGEIYNAELSAKMNSRLCSDIGKLPETGASSSGKNQSGGFLNGQKLVGTIERFRHGLT